MKLPTWTVVCSTHHYGQQGTGGQVAMGVGCSSQHAAIGRLVAALKAEGGYAVEVERPVIQGRHLLWIVIWQGGGGKDG